MAALAASALWSCGGGSGGNATAQGTAGAEAAFAPLASPNAWQWLAPAEDPIAAEVAEPIVRCGPADVRLESGGLELSTTSCNYAVLWQPLARPLPRGSHVRLVVWWQDLASTSPAQGHLQLRIDGEELWGRELEIPGPADVADETIILNEDYPAGSRLLFHLRNHGYNTWNLNRIDARLP